MTVTEPEISALDAIRVPSGYKHVSTLRVRILTDCRKIWDSSGDKRCRFGIALSHFGRPFASSLMEIAARGGSSRCRGISWFARCGWWRVAFNPQGKIIFGVTSTARWKPPSPTTRRSSRWPATSRGRTSGEPFGMSGREVAENSCQKRVKWRIMWASTLGEWPEPSDASFEG